MEEFGERLRPLNILAGVADYTQEYALHQILCLAGHQLQIVHSAPLVLHMAQSRAFDLIILDTCLQEGSALGTTRHLRRHTQLQHIPILGLVPQADAPQMISDSLQAGMHGILTLPLAAEPLLAWIASYASSVTVV